MAFLRLFLSFFSPGIATGDIHGCWWWFTQSELDAQLDSWRVSYWVGVRNRHEKKMICKPRSHKHASSALNSNSVFSSSGKDFVYSRLLRQKTSSNKAEIQYEQALSCAIKQLKHNRIKKVKFVFFLNCVSSSSYNALSFLSLGISTGDIHGSWCKYQ